MKTFKNIISPVLLFGAILILAGCSSKGDFEGREYMPDMGHSVAYEANYFVYYDYNTWGSKEDLHKMSQPRKPVSGTIARGYTGFQNASAGNKAKAMERLKADSYPLSGAVPYHYENTDDGRNLASAEIVNNPYPATKAHIDNGKELYNIYCGVCHGTKGDGNGVLWNEGEGPYPNAPTNYLQEEFYNASEGRYYHAIMHGKGVMGSYADKLSYEERWDVIHYIRSLQAKAQGVSFGINEQVVKEGENIVKEKNHSNDENHENDDHHEGDSHDSMDHNEKNT